MNTAPEGIPTTAPETAPGPLAILTATALGGLLGARMARAPLVLAAGAAAVALMRQKQAVTPHAAQPARSKIDQWLDQQLDRDGLLAPAPLPPRADDPACDDEDDYVPEPFLPDDASCDAAPLETTEHFAQLAEPVIRPETPTALSPPIAAARSGMEAEAFQTTSTIENEPPADHSWLLGVAPIPSLHEPATSLHAGETLFASDPTGADHLPTAPTFSVFQGGDLPDEIDVHESSSPAPEHLMPSFSNDEHQPVTGLEGSVLASPSDVADDTSQAGSGAPEIEVHIAAPGEASFDPPAVLADESPWNASEHPSALWPSSNPETLQPPGPVIEAEILLRPRAPVQSNVVPRQPPSDPDARADLAVHDAPAQSVLSAADSSILPRAPVQTPREQRARQTWRSWWRGD